MFAENFNVRLDAQTVTLTVLAVATFANTVFSFIRDKTLQHIKKTGEAVHILSNSNMAASLKSNVVALRASAVALHALADIRKTPGDIAAADAADVSVKGAEMILTNHLDQQAKLDVTNTQ